MDKLFFPAGFYLNSGGGGEFRSYEFRQGLFTSATGL
jgi:hypothetical protein